MISENFEKFQSGGRTDWYVQMDSDAALPPRDWLFSTSFQRNETEFLFSTHYYTITRQERPMNKEFVRAGDFSEFSVKFRSATRKLD